MSEEGTGIRIGADQNPTQAQVQALFDYCPERGLLTNRFTRSRLSSRLVYQGRAAGECQRRKLRG